jgi:phospholipid/cholesterol/gamma-HCH transport system ATP-binding protein
MSLYDNVAFPLREHTKKSESEIKRIVLEKLEITGLAGAEKKLPGEISGGMRKRAGLARALVLDPEIILCDEPDSGLDPVRTAYLSQLLIDLNAQIDATILIVTHNINLARTVPDNLGMLFRKELIMFGPREVLLTSEEPVVSQFLNGRRLGPIGMSEEKDSAQMAREQAEVDAGHADGSTDEDVRGVVPQIVPSPGLPERKGVRRRKDRVMKILHNLPPAAQEGIIESLTPAEQQRYGVHPHMLVGAGGRPQRPSLQDTGVALPSNHQGELPSDQIARLPNTGWQDSPRFQDPPTPGGTQRTRPRDPGQGGA